VLILSSEPLHPACSIHQFLLTGEEGMAGRTDLHPEVLHRGASVDHITTGTGDGGLKILRMNLRFQLVSSFSLPAFGGSALPFGLSSGSKTHHPELVDGRDSQFDTQI